jgi:UDP-N-acetylglucosamine 2-epimerase (non-hydrolysing)
LKKKILIFFGTRPEIIKLAPVVHALRKAGFNPLLCDTGQHRDLSRPLLRWFGLKPNHKLRLMTERQSLAKLSSRALEAVDRLLERIKPSLVICQGDTTTAMTVGLASYYKKIPVAHVEAGLRTWDRFQPFPEEANRRILSVVADLHFAPTKQAATHLRNEHVPAKSIWVTGNTAIDALLWTVRRGRGKPGGSMPPRGRYVLVTAHRRESFGKRIAGIGTAIRTLARRHPDWQWIVPLHPNPNAGPILKARLRGLSNVKLCKPLPYDRFCLLLSQCRFAISDSGGVQEDAPALGRPVIVVREKTERPEAMSTGHLQLVGYDPRKIVRIAEGWIRSPARLKQLSKPVFPYGDGKAAVRIAQRIKKFLR